MLVFSFVFLLEMERDGSLDIHIGDRVDGEQDEVVFDQFFGMDGTHHIAKTFALLCDDQFDFDWSSVLLQVGFQYILVSGGDHDDLFEFIILKELELEINERYIANR